MSENSRWPERRRWPLVVGSSTTGTIIGVVSNVRLGFTPTPTILMTAGALATVALAGLLLIYLTLNSKARTRNFIQIVDAFRSDHGTVQSN